MDISDYPEKCRVWANISSQFIGAIFDAAKPYIDENNQSIDPYVRFISTQLFIDCSLTSESALILAREGKEWDADILVRSVLEGSFKYVYMLSGSDDEVSRKAHEYGEILSQFNQLKRSARAQNIIEHIPGIVESFGEPLLGVIASDDELNQIRNRYSKRQRQEIEQRWSFGGLTNFFLASANKAIHNFGYIIYDYGMRSHTLHKDGDGVKMVWERYQRSKERQYAIKMAHMCRIFSDICTFSKLRLLFLLLRCNADRGILDNLITKYSPLFKEFDEVYAMYSKVEYGESEDCSSR